MDTDILINEQDLVNNLKDIIGSKQFVYQDLVDGCSKVTDLMYTPMAIEFNGKMVSGEEKETMFKKHMVEPYLCWNYTGMMVKILEPTGVDYFMNHGFNVLSLDKVIQIIAH